MGIHLGVRSRERSTKFNPEAAITFQRSLRSCSPPLIALPSQSPVRTADIAQPTKQHSFLTLSNPQLFHQSRGGFPVRGLPRLPLRGSAPSGASISDTLSASPCRQLPFRVRRTPPFPRTLALLTTDTYRRKRTPVLLPGLPPRLRQAGRGPAEPELTVEGLGLTWWAVS